MVSGNHYRLLILLLSFLYFEQRGVIAVRCDYVAAMSCAVFVPVTTAEELVAPLANVMPLFPLRVLDYLLVRDDLSPKGFLC